MRIAPIVLSLGLVTGAVAAGYWTEAAGLRFEVPASWARVPAPSEYRAAQFRIPPEEGDAESAEAILFHYGPAQAKFVQSNLDGWTRLFEQPDGKPAKDVAVTTTRKSGDVTLTVMSLTATYTGGKRPTGTVINPKAVRSDWSLLAGVIEGGNGPWFWRIIGPQKTLEKAKPAFEALLDSAKIHQ